MQPERDWEGAGYDLAPSSFTGQTGVRQLRDPYPFREGHRTWLFFAVAGESGIAAARLNLP